MDNLTYILKRVEAGANVRFLMDYYGRETVEVERGWLLGRARLRLSPSELEQLKAHLRDRRRRSGSEDRSIRDRVMRMLGAH